MKKKKMAQDAPQEKRVREIKYIDGKIRWWMLPVIALILALIIEGLNQASVSGLIDYVVHRPLYFLYNVLLILTTLTFSGMFKRRPAILCTIIIAWLAVGVSGYVVARQRTLPMTGMDILTVTDFIGLTTVYFAWYQILLVCVVAFAIIFVLAQIYVRMPREKSVNYAFTVPCFFGLVILCVALYMMGETVELFPRHIEDRVAAYDEYGFTTCFITSFRPTGVSKPDEYSDETVTDIVEEIDTAEEETPRTFGSEDNLSRPNIIFVQLESFFDVTTLVDSSYSTEPTPNFKRLARDYPSGILYMPTIGGGTANSEFEILTGMNVDFFSAGEYPYATTIKETTTESIAYNLDAEGYTSTAVHNYTAPFYDRDKVYANLGFDRFVSMEYMPYLTYTSVGWAEDTILTSEIIKAMNSTTSRDFVMAITVESHGKYDENYVYQEGDVDVRNLPEGLNREKFCSYLHLITATDNFIGDLTEALSNYDEPVICVFYGDHLPGLDLTVDMLTTNSLYANRYVIWSNYDLDIEAPDMQAYRLGAYVLGELGMTGGNITKLHQSVAIDETGDEYLEKLQVLEFDLLFGDLASYDGVNPYEPKSLKLGSEPIVITNAERAYGRVLVTGENFTEYSKIISGETKYDTAFIDDGHIVALVPQTDIVESVRVAQISPDGVELSSTQEITVK